MPSRIDLRRVARRDLLEHFEYLELNAGLPTAERFLDSAQASFEALFLQPLMGAPLHLKSPELATLRKWRIKGFDNHLVFYAPGTDGGVSIARVLHAATDWWTLLGCEE